MNSDTLKGQWKQLMGRAKQTWSKITDDELLKIKGNVQQLSGLIQERYGVAREDAEKQIENFLEMQGKTASRSRAVDYEAAANRHI